MTLIYDFKSRRDLIISKTMLRAGKMIDRAIAVLLTGQHITAHAIAGLLAHRAGAFVRAYRGDKFEMLRTMYDIMAREAQRDVDTKK